MHRKLRLSLAIAALAAAGLAGWYYSASLPEPQKPKAVDEVASPQTADELISRELGEQGMSADEIADLLNHPRVTTYFEREQEKRRLADYFNEGGGDAQQVWQLIESIEAEGRVMAYEALALKLAWLERNSDDKAGFEEASQGLIAQYRQRAEQSAQEYDPHADVPGFTEYKQAEERIIREVRQMDSFPDGMTEQEYLRRRLQEAREEAYR